MNGRAKLIVLAAFAKTDAGALVQAFEPRQVDTEERAVLAIGTHYYLCNCQIKEPSSKFCTN
jgi:hypothetical protein